MEDRRTRKGMRLRHSHCLLLLFLVILFLFRKVLFTSGLVLSNPALLDLTHHYYPLRLFGFGLLKKGIIPLWNPYILCGRPFVATWHSAVFYPLNAIFLVLPPGTALNYSMAFHLFLSGALTYAFVNYLVKDRFSALVAGVTFMLAGPQVAHLLPGHIFNPLPWLPLSLLLAELAVRTRRMLYYLLAGVVLALQVLAGHPQYMLYCAGAVVLFLAYRVLGDCRKGNNAAPLGTLLPGLAVMLVAAAGLSAVQLIPSAEFVGLSGRALLSGPESLREVSLPPENLVTLIAPGFFGDMMGVRYWGRWLFWETCLYAGILPLALAFIGAILERNRYTFFFAGLAAISIVLSFGHYSPLFPLLYRFVPGFNLFRAQAKFITLTAFSLSVLAGYGCLAVTRAPLLKQKAVARAGRIIFVIAALLLLASVLVTVTGGERSPAFQLLLRYRAARGFEGTPPPDAGDAALLAGIYRVARAGILVSGLAAALSAALVILAASGRPRRAFLKAAMLCVVVVDLLYFGSKYVIATPVSGCYWPRRIIDLLKSDPSRCRVLAPQINVPGANQNMNDRIYSIGGYQTINVGAFKQYVDYSQGVAPEKARPSLSLDRVTPMIEALGLKYLLLPEGLHYPRKGYRRRQSTPHVVIFEKAAVTPRAYICRRFTVAEDAGAALEEVRRASGDSPSLVVLGEKPDGVFLGKAGEPAPEDRAEIVDESPMEVIVDARLAEPGFLVLSDVFYPGWEVDVDGSPGKILRANHAFRAVPLSPGTHRVRFRYRPQSFRYGALISLASLAVLFITLLYILLRENRSDGFSQGRGSVRVRPNL